MNNKLHENGYIIIKNPLSELSKKKALSSIIHINTQKTMINYNNLNLFINNDFIPKINGILNWSSIYLKYRFSNSQNSRDASTFHGDVYNYVDNNLTPIFTALIYFDDAALEIVPKSHIKNTLSTKELYEKRTFKKLF